MTPKLEAAYAEPHRRYHTRAHIEDCLAELDRVVGLGDRDRRRLGWAIWWHDAVYDPTRGDNEAMSAEMADRDLAELGATAEDRAEVARLILLTAGHTVQTGDRLGAILVSIDLSILGREPAVYDRYAAAIREEYGFVPDDLYRSGRAAVLRGFLEAPAIYPDPAYRARFEAPARANLAREIAALEAPRTGGRLADFDFDLPEDRIALRPVEPRDAARMLVVRPGTAFEERMVRDLPDLLQRGDALVFNDTKVIPARLSGVRVRDDSSIHVEATLHKRLSPNRWTAFMKPGKRLQPGDRLMFGAEGDTACELDRLDATLHAKLEDGEVALDFDLSGPDLDQAIALHGRMPLPPYIAGKRAEDERDFRDYQTVYARDPGSIAAPTAGLHFTPELIERLKARGVSTHFVTLHVGAGTFLPVKVEDVAEHRMHSEFGLVTGATADALNAVRAKGGRVVCVGTTALRLIESAAGEDGTIQPFAAETAIFITPGYRFRAVDVLMTNFHLPRSTLFMLVAAFAGLEVMKRAYATAVEDGFRFYSYGDASLLFRAR